MRSPWLLLLAAMALWLPPARAQHVTETTEGDASIGAYRAHLATLQQQVAACERDAKACEADSIGADDHVQLGSGQAVVRYDWVRDHLSQMHDPKTRMQASKHSADVAARLAQQIHDSSGTEASTPLSQDAEAKRDAILHRREFRDVTDYSASQYLSAKIADWVDRLFVGISRVGRHAPWIVPALLIAAGLGLAALLLLWIRRVLERHRLRPLAPEGVPGRSDREDESRNWAEMARVFSEQHDWRQAVYCLYWASIAHLESRRFWRPDRTRTPREYLRLLESGSAGRVALTRQTNGFERVWYGDRSASAQDYATALSSYGTLSGEAEKAGQTT